MTEHILNKIKEYDTIIIHRHIRPDGDSYGAQFGLKYIIEATFPNKQVYAVGEETKFLLHIGRTENVNEETYKYALVIVVDTGSSDRISNESWSLGDYIIKIDHHIPVDPYGNYQWEDTTYPSCAAMITQLYMNHSDELKLPKKAAIALFNGITTDTGRFVYRGVNENTFRQAAVLVETGIDINEDVYKVLYKRKLEMVRYEGYIYSNFKVTDNGFAYLKMPLSVQKDLGLTSEETALKINSLADIEGVKIWGLFIEYEIKDEIRGRIRSAGINIQKLAKRFDGGGHAVAAGTKHSSWESVDELILYADELCKNN